MLSQIWNQLLDEIKKPDTQLKINDIIIKPLLKMISDHIYPYAMFVLGLFIVNIILLIIVIYNQYIK